MTGLEILFITSLLPVFIMWGWFVVQGFQTSKGWGWGLILFFPISPFLFAYRFERKTRKAFTYFIASLVIFAAITAYAHFFSLSFFNNLTNKTVKKIESISFSREQEAAKPLNLPPPTPIPEVSPDFIKQQAAADQTKETEKTPAPKPRAGRKAIAVDEAANYLGKSIIITTDTTTIRGKLLSVGVGGLQIKKSIGGGTAEMIIPKSRITKLEVYP